MTILSLQQQEEDLSKLTIVSLPADSTGDDLIKAYSENAKKDGDRVMFLVGDKKVIAKRKFTFRGNVAITAYLHIAHVTRFQYGTVIQKWRF